MYYNMSLGSVTTLWSTPTGTQFNGVGITADDTNGRLLYDTSARIGQAAYGAPTAPSVIGGHYYYNASNNTGGVATNYDICMANGQLYSWSEGSTTFTRGIYSINTTPQNILIGTTNVTGACVETALWTDSTVAANQYHFEGLTYRAKDGLFYGINTNTNHTKGLYSIDAFGGGGPVFIAAMPSGHTRIDSLTVDDTGDTFYMAEMNASTSSTAHDGNIFIASFDMNSLAYGSTYSFGYDDTSNRGTGITWAPRAVPEPATCAAMIIGVGALLRRRKK